MSLFTKPAPEIQPSDIEAFCDSLSEGVRVEYKSELTTDDIPKIISSFANSQGGVLLIGINAKDGKAVKPYEGISKKPGIEEQIVQSSITGIHPPVTPEVFVRNAPHKPENVIVIVRVEESIYAPHAIQNSTRVYVRTGKISQPYELSEIDRIEFQLKRREEPRKKKISLLDSAKERMLRYSQEPPRPNLKVSVIPAFPCRPILPLGDLYPFATKQNIYGYTANAVRIHGGLVSSTTDSYMEINEHGLIYAVTKLEWNKGNSSGSGYRFLSFSHLVIHSGRVLKVAEDLYRSCGYMGSVEIIIGLDGIFSYCLRYSDSGDAIFIKDNFSKEETIANSGLTLCYGLQGQIYSVLHEIFRNILWVFQLEPSDLEPAVKKILAANKLV